MVLGGRRHLKSNIKSKKVKENLDSLQIVVWTTKLDNETNFFGAGKNIFMLLNAMEKSFLAFRFNNNDNDENFKGKATIIVKKSTP